MTMEQGYVQVYTGDGKGKTTAAVGLAMRAAAANLREIGRASCRERVLFRV